MGNKQPLSLDFSSRFFDSGYYPVLDLGRDGAVILTDEVN
jgi:hypothetical protein